VVPGILKECGAFLFKDHAVQNEQAIVLGLLALDKEGSTFFEHQELLNS
jgi:hypothetical protein